MQANLNHIFFCQYIFFHIQDQVLEIEKYSPTFFHLLNLVHLSFHLFHIWYTHKYNDLRTFKIFIKIIFFHLYCIWSPVSPPTSPSTHFLFTPSPFYYSFICIQKGAKLPSMNKAWHIMLGQGRAAPSMSRLSKTM